MQKIMVFAVVIIFTTALYPAPARAVFMTGDELSRSCLGETPKDIYTCAGYISGIADYHVLMQSLGTAPTIDFCLPATLTVEDTAIAVIRYLKKAPQNNDFIAAPAVALALHQIYPCAVHVKKKKHGG